LAENLGSNDLKEARQYSVAAGRIQTMKAAIFRYRKIDQLLDHCFVKPG